MVISLYPPAMTYRGRGLLILFSISHSFADFHPAGKAAPLVEALAQLLSR